MRAIENGRYLARAANTGVSGFVDPYGRVLEKSKLFEQAVLVQDVRLVRTANDLHAASATSSPGCRWRLPLAACWRSS